MADTYLVTGGMGCIGAWTLHHLRREGKRAVNFDLSDDRHRLDWLMNAEEQADFKFVQGDLVDADAVKAAFVENEITHVIHLAALQVPFCRANPTLGAQVNVTGTVNIFQAAHETGVSHVAYASSIGVYGPPSDFAPGLVPHDAPRNPRTLYGAYKVCNEGTASVYFHEHGMTSACLRPYTVYGVGRDQGMTSEPTHALVAAAKGEAYDISFSGAMQFHFASDVARQFILAAEKPVDGAAAFNLGGPGSNVDEFAAVAREIMPDARISVADNPLPFPEGFDDSQLRKSYDVVYERPLRDGIAETVAHIRRLGDEI